MDDFRESLYIFLGRTPPEDVRLRQMESLFYRICETSSHKPSIFAGHVFLLYSKGWKDTYAPQLNTFYIGKRQIVELDIGHSEWFEPEQIRMILELIDKKDNKGGAS